MVKRKYHSNVVYSDSSYSLCTVEIFPNQDEMSPAIVISPGNSLTIWHCAVESSELDDDSTFRSLMERLTTKEQQQIAKFVFPIDQKRAFLSLLLQHAIVIQKFRFSLKADYQLIRTNEVSLRIAS